MSELLTIGVCPIPLCPTHNREYNEAPSADTACVAAAKAAKRMTRKRLTNQALVGHVQVRQSMTRAFTARRYEGEIEEVGVIALFCAASMCGSQFKGKKFKHLFGLDVLSRYAPSFERNNDAAPLIIVDINTLTKPAFRTLVDKHGGKTVKRLIFLVSIDCSLASKANSKAKQKEKETFYRTTVDKIKELQTEACTTHTVFGFWEFLQNQFVKGLIRKTFPEASVVELSGTIYENRERLYLTQGFDKDATVFREELATRVDKFDGSVCVGYALTELGYDVKDPNWKLFSKSWTKIQMRLFEAGCDPWNCRAPTITTMGLTLTYDGLFEETPNEFTIAAEKTLTPADLLFIRSAGGDYPFTFDPMDNNRTKAMIVGMGVSLVVASAARAAFERVWFHFDDGA